MPREQYSFVTSLRDLKVDKPIGANWKIAGELKISTSSSVAKRLMTNSLGESIGKLEIGRILSGDPFVYAVSDYPVKDASAERQLSILFTHLTQTQLFFNMLWLVKDNSVNFELGFLQYPYVNGPSPARVSSNHLSASFSDASGQRGETVFSTAELTEAINFYNVCYGKSHGAILEPESNFAPQGDVGRISRAFYFVQAARASWHLPEKVAYYCTCFESLVSTSPSELAHQVAERVATLIGKDAPEALKVYRNLKRAYDTRSKLVHGGRLTASRDRYLTDSRNCDRHLRSLLHLLLTNQGLREAVEQSPQKVDEFFLGRIFGGCAAK